MMAKLYWRIKRDGKWSWEAATPDNTRVKRGRYIQGTVLYFGPTRQDWLTILAREAPVAKPEVYIDDES